MQILLQAQKTRWSQRLEFTAATVVRVSQWVPFSLPKLPGCCHVPPVLAYFSPV